MTEPTEPQVFPSTIIMIDADGNLTTDGSKAVEGEVIETLPDGSQRHIWFTAGGRPAGETGP